MAILRCTLCREKFPWDIGAGYPLECPRCHQHIGHDREDDDIVMPSIARAREVTKATDKVYRDIETASIQRAEAAASMLGVPTSDMADLKITDLKPTIHPGAVAAPPLQNNAVHTFMQQNPGAGGFRGVDGAQYSPQVMTGPEPNAGARARTVLQNHHGEISRGHAVSDAPAAETLQPGYRRRG